MDFLYLNLIVSFFNNGQSFIFSELQLCCYYFKIGTYCCCLLFRLEISTKFAANLVLSLQPNWTRKHHLLLLQKEKEARSRWGLTDKFCRERFICKWLLLRFYQLKCYSTLERNFAPSQPACLPATASRRLKACTGEIYFSCERNSESKEITKERLLKDIPKHFT